MDLKVIKELSSRERNEADGGIQDLLRLNRLPDPIRWDSVEAVFCSGAGSDEERSGIGVNFFTPTYTS